MDEELRHIERVLEAACADEFGPEPASGQRTIRLDAPHAGPNAGHLPPVPRPPAAARPAEQRLPISAAGGSLMSGLTWTALVLGTTALVCGVILLGWSVVTGRQELWAVGMPIALGGQVALLAGLVLQLDRLWHDSRKAAAKLDNVDEQLHELKSTATLLGTTHGPSANFYAHMAGGAGPQLLLSDLKSQLDLLALKLNREEG
jgi:hypothetical protein